MAAPLDYQTSSLPSPRRPPNVWFGAVSALSAGLAWLLVMTSPAFSRGILAASVAVIFVVSFVAGIVGLKRGVASMILSILGLAMTLFMALGSLLNRVSQSGS